MPTQHANEKTILVIEARYYEKIADDMVRGAEPVFAEAGYEIERLPVTGVFEVPAACEMAIQAGLKDPHHKYAGIMAMGCVIRGETDHYDHICREASRALMDITTSHLFPLGFAILTCENMKQAEVRADPDQKNKGAEAAQAVLRMIELRRHFRGREDG
ncbi:MAG: 6,7-dimethyl-8-ribityllumazine synthase [Rhodospirillales bacterium]|nr:6,7-dimethyl-8-ribityllumazine synthase [Rhodospirillales bacterium]MBO6786810.1 6,7-dimethyl-8-ribityllumazine synthase [Rhodospirillales bacterium]